MLVVLKKVKIHDDISDETTCFSAEIWADDVKIATVENSGKGGSNDYWPINRGKFSEFVEHCKTIPHEFECDITDQYVDTLLADYEEQKLIKRNCKKNTMYRIKGDTIGEWRIIKAPYSPHIEQELVKKYGDTLETIANKTA